MKLAEYVTTLTAKGYSCFTSEQAVEAMRVSIVAARAALRRLKQKGVLAQPINGFYVIVPPEYRILGCRPAEHFITELMKQIGGPYYVGLLTAAQYYGAAHHRPQQFQVITTQKRRSIACGKVKIVFITKKDAEITPIQNINTQQGPITASTAEATAMDLILYANRCGGLDNVLTVLVDLIDKIDAKKLLKLASQSKEIAWAQRLGFLLESLKEKKISDELSKILDKRNAHVRELVSIRSKKMFSKDSSLNMILHSPPSPGLKKTKSKKWKLIINKKLEPDT